MRVWITKANEPYHFEKGASLMRAGTLCNTLAEQGHEVTWWGSTFSHIKKKHVVPENNPYHVNENLEIVLLEGPGYSKNISLRRYFHNKVLARNFSAEARRREKPDVIVSSLPIHNITFEAVKYGLEKSVPVLVDVRDIWPDFLLVGLPRLLRPLGRLFLAPDFHKARFALANAAGIVAVSETYLEWALKRAGRSRRSTDAVFYLGARRMREISRQEALGILPWLKALDGKTVFCFLGTFGRTYDLSTVIRAARILRERGENEIHFVLAGDGDNLPEIRKAAEGLDNVTLPGWLGKDEMTALLRNSHVGLAPYRSDAPQSLPNKPFNYFAAGLPVICSLDGEMREMITRMNLGWYFESENIEALLNAIHSSLSSIRQDNSEMNITEVTSNFSYDKLYSDYADFVGEIAGANS